MSDSAQSSTSATASEIALTESHRILADAFCKAERQFNLENSARKKDPNTIQTGPSPLAPSQLLRALSDLATQKQSFSSRQEEKAHDLMVAEKKKKLQSQLETVLQKQKVKLKSLIANLKKGPSVNEDYAGPDGCRVSRAVLLDLIAVLID